MDAVREDAFPSPQEATLVEEGAVAARALRLAWVKRAAKSATVFALGDVALHEQVVFVGERGEALQQLNRASWHEPRGDHGLHQLQRRHRLDQRARLGQVLLAASGAVRESETRTTDWPSAKHLIC